MTLTTSAKPSLPRRRSPPSPITRHGRSNIHSTSISTPSAIWWNAASVGSSSFVASQLASRRPPEITVPSSLSLLSSYGCAKCPHHLALLWRRLSLCLCPGILLGFPGFVLPEQRFRVGVSRQTAGRSTLLQECVERVAPAGLEAVLIEP